MIRATPKMVAPAMMSGTGSRFRLVALAAAARRLAGRPGAFAFAVSRAEGVEGNPPALAVQADVGPHVTMEAGNASVRELVFSVHDPASILVASPHLKRRTQFEHT